MSVKYFAILTHQGAAKLANATALGTTLNLTQLAIGDGNGTLPVPDAAQTRLINQTRIAPLNALSVDPENPSQIVAEQIIPENEGGYWIRELGLFDDAGVLIAVANCPETYKPQLQEGSGRTQTIRMVVVVSSTAAVTLKIDPSVVLATRKYADDLLAGHLKAANPHPQYLQIADIASFTPVGVPLPYPSATPPAGWLKCNGAAFNKGQYPKLAALFPSGNLPDLRGEFIRGWDDGRAVDSGRALMSPQEDTIQNITGMFGRTQLFKESVLSGPFKPDGSQEMTLGLTPSNSPDIGYGAPNWIFDTSLAVRTAAETRPRNVAFNYIVRAA
ncbi:phage tail protein [Kosakonia cowanii]|jgi:phage-related tail fiber protein|uniref:phage tail protein n=1 Tax=Kosakonia cowanii TaxID=208223 RepID=UPI001F561D5B|nr:phage tail protein [Kosakonia cowanii]MDT3413337.1 phage-related tail fiber protein [Atlantibacter sp. SORGH_AS_0304]